MSHPDANLRSRSIMIVSKRASFAEEISGAFRFDENNTITNKNESFQAMNGSAVSLAFDHDIVIFETDPDDQSELRAIETLLSQRLGNTVFLALTDNDVSISKARQLRKIGIDEVLPLSIDNDGLRAVVDEHLSSRAAPPPLVLDRTAALGRVLMVTQARGGAGATTVAVNLACSLVEGRSSLFRKGTKSRVVLVDLDIQYGNSNVFLDIEDNGGFLQLVDAVAEPDERFFQSTLQTHQQGVDVLCAPVPFMPLSTVRTDLIEKLINFLRKRYDYVIVDLPRAVVDWVEPVLKNATQLVLVTDTSVPCVRQARRLIDLYREEKVGLPVEVVVNRERQPLIKSEHLREAEKVLETKIRHWLPDNPKVARGAVDLGQPIVAIKPRSDIGKALRKLSSALSEEQQRHHSIQITD